MNNKYLRKKRREKQQQQHQNTYATNIDNEIEY